MFILISHITKIIPVALSTTLKHLVLPLTWQNPHLVIFDWVFTRNDNFNNENCIKLEPFMAFYKMSAIENDKKIGISITRLLIS